MPIDIKEGRKKYKNRSWADGDSVQIKIVKNRKTQYSLGVKSSYGGEIFSTIDKTTPNPDKISFGTIRKKNVKLEFCSYKKSLKKAPENIDPEIIPYSVTYPKKFPPIV